MNSLDSTNISSTDNNYALIRVLCKQKNGLNVCHVNAQSLVRKIDELRFLFENSGVDVICVSETWFAPDMPDELFKVNGYKLFRADRQGHAGGAAMYVRSEISCVLNCKSCFGSSIEYLFVDVNFGNEKLLVGTVYRPNRLVDISSFLVLIQSLSLSYTNIIIAGDFNSNLLVESNLKNDFISLGLYPVNTTLPTHFTNTANTLLDLFLVNDTSKLLLYDQLSCAIFSKHDLIFLTYDFQLNNTPISFSYRDFKHINYTQLDFEFNHIDWNIIYNTISIDEQVAILNNNLSYLYDKFVPIKTKTVKPEKRPWFNYEIKLLIEQRDSVYKRWKRFKTPELHNLFKQLRSKVTKEIKTSKTKFYENKFGNAVDSKQTWKSIRDIGISKKASNPTSAIDVNELNTKFVNIPMPVIQTNVYENSICDNYCDNSFSFCCVDQFDVVKSFLSIKSNAVGFDEIHPVFLKALLPRLLPILTYIFNSIFTKSIYPSCWKKAKILPTVKSVNEYRPIAILPFLSKVFEHLMSNQLNKYFCDKSLLTDRQSGYRPKRSCITALLDVTEDIRVNLDASKVTFLTLLDHSKAFDTVDHDILCTKLVNMYNCSLSASNLVSSYLRERSQAVCVNNVTSQFLSVTRGVPQGSLLGPLLFSIYVNDLPKILKFCKLHMYADDVQLYASCNLESMNECVTNINHDLFLINDWALKNGLCLNPKKSKCIVIYKKKIDPSIIPKLTLNGLNIVSVDTTKNLGIIFNKNLTWNDHINCTVGRVYGMIRTLWVTQYFTPYRIRILLAKTYLIPTLLYGCELFANCDSTSRQKLNVLYNNIARYIFGLKRSDHISSFSKQIFNLTFDNLLKLRSLLMLHKIIISKEPKYLYERLRFLRSNRSNQLIQLKHTQLNSERQFYINSIRLWNSLPNTLQAITNPVQFKSKLSHYFSLLQ